jgi:hypothetical protein
MYAHTHTHTRAHTHTRTHARARARARTHAHAHARTHSNLQDLARNPDELGEDDGIGSCESEAYTSGSNRQDSHLYPCIPLKSLHLLRVE